MALEGFAASKRSSLWETPWGENPLKLFMALEGFEPPTPRLRVWCSNQAELQSHSDVAKPFRLRPRERSSRREATEPQYF